MGVWSSGVRRLDGGSAFGVHHNRTPLSRPESRRLYPEAWKMAAALMARHIGGAVNYVAVSGVLVGPGDSSFHICPL